jgi:hypothetical protein
VDDVVQIGNHYILKNSKSTGGITVIKEVEFGIVFVRDDTTNRGFWLSKKELLETYEYTHYIPTHIEMG